MLQKIQMQITQIILQMIKFKYLLINNFIKVKRIKMMPTTHQFKIPSFLGIENQQQKALEISNKKM